MTIAPATSRIVSMAVRNDGTRKRGHGLKDKFFEVDLSGVDRFVGPNDAGKSTRLVLPYVVALGLATKPTSTTQPYLGGLPERTSAVLVIQTPDGAREIVRDLSSTDNSGVNRKAMLDVAEVMGRPPVRWDLRDFSTGPDSVRSDVLSAVVKAGGDAGDWTVERVVDTLPATDLRIQLLTAVSVDLSVGDWMERAATWAGADGGVFTQRNEVLTKAQAHLSELERTLPAAPEGDHEQDAITAHDLRTRIAEVEAQLRDLDRAALAWSTWRQEGDRLHAAVTAAGAALARAQAVPVRSPVDLAPLVAAVEARLADLRAADKALAAAQALVVEARPADCTAEEAALALATDRKAQARAAFLRAVEAVDAAQAAVTAAEAPVDPELAARHNTAAEQVNQAQAQRSTLGERLADAQARLAARKESSADTAVCVHCGAHDPLGHGPLVAQAQALVDDRAECVADADFVVRSRTAARDQALAALEAARSAREQAITSARAALTQAQAAHGDASQEAAAADAAVLAAERALADARTAGQRDADAQRANAVAAAYASQAKASDALAAARRALAQDCDDAEGVTAANLQRERAIANAQREAEAADAALAAWSQREAPPAPSGLAEAEATRAALQAQLDEVETRISAWVKVSQHVALIERARESVDAAQAKLDEVKALRAALAYTAAQIAADAYGPLERAGNLLLEGLPVKFYVDGSGDFGAVEASGTKVCFWALGGGRERLIAAAMTFAFAVVSRAPWRGVAIDDFETIRAAWRPILLANLVKAQREGLVSNVLIGWQSETPLPPVEGVRDHNLGTSGAAVREAA